MSESKVRELSEIEARAALKARQAARPAGPRLLDQFGRPIGVGDGVLLSQTEPMAVVWRVRELTPATEPDYVGRIWVDVVTRTRVLMPAGVPTPGVVLGTLADALPPSGILV